MFVCQSPAANLEKHGEHLPRGDHRPGGSRRRHNSSDGFFNNDPLRAPAGAYTHTHSCESYLNNNPPQYDTCMHAYLTVSASKDCLFLFLETHIHLHAFTYSHDTLLPTYSFASHPASMQARMDLHALFICVCGALIPVCGAGY